MRNLLFSALLAGSLAIPVVTAAEQPAPPGQIQTREAQTTATVQDAAAAPMHDLNVMRAKIPPVLLAAMADPYVRPAPANCGAIISRVRELSVALGDDLDVPDGPESTNREKGEHLGKELVRAGAESLLPLRGFVRRLTGAEQHDRLVQQAILAGSVRRGYLKGLGEARGCAPPGTPRHFAVMPQPVSNTDTRRPNYPIH